MKALHIIIFLCVANLLNAQPNIISQADEAYMADKFETAMELYQDALKLEGSSPQLYYNMGNTAYRLGYLGDAVLYYKRALKQDPSFTDARTNLEFVQTKLVDEQTHNKSLTTKITENVMFLMTPNAWAIVGIIFLIVFLYFLSQYILGSTVGIRKISFFGGLAAIALCVLTTYIAFYSSTMARDNREAVITSPVVQLSTVPRVPTDKSQQAFTLHEGTLVEIIDSLTVPTDTVNPKWIEVRVNNEHRAWLPATTLTRI